MGVGFQSNGCGKFTNSHTSPVGTYKRVEALQVSHDFKTIFAISSEREKNTMTRYIPLKLVNILGYY